MRAWRRQPPAHTPLRAAPILSALLRPSATARAELVELLRSRHDADEVTLWDSGTTALRVAIETAIARTGRRVVALPAFACYDVAAAAVGADARVVLYDIEPTTLLPDTDSLERALGAELAALVIVPLFGISPDWDALRARARAAGAILIEDAAQAFGGMWRDRRLGGFGDLSVLSFGRGKGWSGGGGGALLVRGADLASPAAGADARPSLAPLDRARREPTRSADARRLSLALAQWALARPALYALPARLPFLHLGETLYHEPGAPRRIGAGCAGVVLELVDAAETEAQRRVENARWYRAGLPSSTAIRVLPEARPGYLRYPVRLNGRPARLAADVAGRSLGIERVYPGTLARLPQLAAGRLLDTQAGYEGADALVRELFTLPTHSGVEAWERQRIVALAGG